MCGKDDFKTSAGLTNHRRLAHGKEKDKLLRKVQKKELSKSKRLSTTLPIDLDIVCPICGLKCNTTVGLKLHLVKCKITQ